MHAGLFREHFIEIFHFREMIFRSLKRQHTIIGDCLWLAFYYDAIWQTTRGNLKLLISKITYRLKKTYLDTVIPKFSGSGKSGHPQRIAANILVYFW